MNKRLYIKKVKGRGRGVFCKDVIAKGEISLMNFFEIVSDENNEYKVGDIVIIEECRPLSKDKNFTVIGKK